MPAGSVQVARLRAVLLGVFFASGFAALLYEVMWLRALRTVFGSGAQAAAATLAVFFAGLAAGSAFFGQRATRSKRPLRLYAALEAATAVAALPFFALPITHEWVYAVLGGAGPDTAPLSLVRVALAFLLLFPAAFFMGGTLPVMGEVFVRRPDELAVTTPYWSTARRSRAPG